MITKVFIRFEKLHGETFRAVLLLIDGKEYWFTKKFCWDFILNKKLGGNMIIPTWLYKEKFGKEPDDYEAACIIEKHKPIKKEVINNEPDESLIR